MMKRFVSGLLTVMLLSTPVFSALADDPGAEVAAAPAPAPVTTVTEPAQPPVDVPKVSEPAKEAAPANGTDASNTSDVPKTEETTSATEPTTTASNDVDASSNENTETDTSAGSEGNSTTDPVVDGENAGTTETVTTATEIGNDEPTDPEGEISLMGLDDLQGSEGSVTPTQTNFGFSLKKSEFDFDSKGYAPDDLIEEFTGDPLDPAFVMYKFLYPNPDKEAEEKWLVLNASKVTDPGKYKLRVEVTIATKTSVEKEFTIKPEETTIEWSGLSCDYTGSAQVPTVTVTAASGSTLTKDTDYTVTCEEEDGAINIGTYTFTVALTESAVGRYTLPSNTTNDLEISPLEITVTAKKAYTRKYDESDNDYDFALDNLTIADSNNNEITIDEDITIKRADADNAIGLHDIEIDTTDLQNYSIKNPTIVTASGEKAFEILPELSTPITASSKKVKKSDPVVNLKNYPEGGTYKNKAIIEIAGEIETTEKSAEGIPTTKFTALNISIDENGKVTISDDSISTLPVGTKLNIVIMASNTAGESVVIDKLPLTIIAGTSSGSKPKNGSSSKSSSSSSSSSSSTTTPTEDTDSDEEVDLTVNEPVILTAPMVAGDTFVYGYCEMDSSVQLDIYKSNKRIATLNNTSDCFDRIGVENADFWIFDLSEEDMALEEGTIARITCVTRHGDAITTCRAIEIEPKAGIAQAAGEAIISDIDAESASCNNIIFVGEGDHIEAPLLMNTLFNVGTVTIDRSNGELTVTVSADDFALTDIHPTRVYLFDAKPDAEIIAESSSVAADGPIDVSSYNDLYIIVCVPATLSTDAAQDPSSYMEYPDDVLR